jgi:enolase
MKIKSIKARTIPNSRHQPAIEIIINKKYKAAAPSGASMGSSEVKSFSEKGIEFAVDFVNKYKDFKWMNFEEFVDLEQLDEFIPIVGGNTVIALQFALLKAMSNNNIWKFLNPNAKTLPTPVGNVIGGGAHTKKASNDIQEFLLIPKGGSFYDKAFVNRHIHKKLKNVLNAKYMTDEGALITSLSNVEVLELLHEHLSDKKNTLGMKVDLGLDIAATEFFKDNKYHYKNFSKTLKKRNMDRKQQIDFVNDIIEKYKLKYVEDPLDENDFKGFSRISKKTLACGDDLITTNMERLKEAIKNNSVNCIIIKPNQIGSIIKTKEVVDFAHKNNIKTIISHRSGETYDATITDLAVAWHIPYLKCGIYGKERKAKLDRGVEIEKQMK